MPFKPTFVGVTMTTTEETRHNAYDAMWELCMYLSVIYSEKLRFLSYFYYRYGISITRNKCYISTSLKYVCIVRAKSSSHIFDFLEIQTEKEINCTFHMRTECI